MIQNIAPKKLYNEYRQKRVSANDYIVVVCKNKILIREAGGRIRFPRLSELLAEQPFSMEQPFAMEGISGRISDSLYLFRIDEDLYFLYPAFTYPDDMEGYHLHLQDNALHWMKFADIRSQADHEVCFAAYTAYHLYQWYRSNQFCGCCGAHTVPDQNERMLYCTKCGNQIYPRIAPAVIAAVTNGDKILLTKYANREYKRYALIAGFTEIGETAEETVRREVMEEAGLSVKNIRYYKSQPWGIDGNLLFGYFAELSGSDEIRMDQNELSAAEWVSREQLKDMDDSFSLTREMMRVFYENEKESSQNIKSEV